jgi:hypothetical protein
VPVLGVTAPTPTPHTEDRSNIPLHALAGQQPTPAPTPGATPAMQTVTSPLAVFSPNRLSLDGSSAVSSPSTSSKLDRPSPAQVFSPVPSSASSASAVPHGGYVSVPATPAPPCSPADSRSVSPFVSSALASSASMTNLPMDESGHLLPQPAPHPHHHARCGSGGSAYLTQIGPHQRHASNVHSQVLYAPSQLHLEKEQPPPPNRPHAHDSFVLSHAEKNGVSQPVTVLAKEFEHLSHGHAHGGREVATSVPSDPCCQDEPPAKHDHARAGAGHVDKMDAKLQGRLRESPFPMVPVHEAVAMVLNNGNASRVFLAYFPSKPSPLALLSLSCVCSFAHSDLLTRALLQCLCPALWSCPSRM